jgi:hypothetical protein
VALGVVGLIFGLGLLFAFPVKWLINYLFTKALIASVFGTPQVSVWQAFGLNILCGFLFKSSSYNTNKSE